MMKKIFTICSWSELPCGLALAHSVEKQCPNWTFECYLLDTPLGKLPSSVTPINPAELPHFEQLNQLYTYEELRSYTKYWILRSLLVQSDAVVYLDPLSFVVAPLEAVEKGLATASILLFPWLSMPLNDKYYPDEKDFLNKGLSDPSILALANNEVGRSFVDWMLDRLQHKGTTNYLEGLGSERLWLMHVPVFFGDDRHCGVQLLPRSGCNVSLINLHEYPSIDAISIVNFRGNVQTAGHILWVQNRNILRKRADFQTFLTSYLLLLQTFCFSSFQTSSPAYGVAKKVISPLSFRSKLTRLLQRISFVVQNKPV